MDLLTATKRVEAARVGRLGTVGPDGQPHLVPCCFVLGPPGARAGYTVYTGIDAKPKSTRLLRRLRNIDAHPAASLLVDHYDEDWTQLWWVRIDGPARVVSDPAEMDDARTLLQAKYPQYTVQVALEGPFIAIDVARWVSWP